MARGHRAYWLRSPWRYRRPEDYTWTYSATLRDIREDVGDEPVTIEKRTGHAGRKGEDYVYVPYTPRKKK